MEAIVFIIPLQICFGARAYTLNAGMVPKETVSFVFPRILMFPETKSKETSGSRENKNN